MSALILMLSKGISGSNAFTAMEVFSKNLQV